MAVSLTSLSHGAGCGCKLSAGDLRPIVSALPRPTDPRVLVGADTSDDAGVVRLTDELAIVQTVDFFTPIVDDPYAFGRIAATNALSDIYAMGATPVSCLNLVAFPLETLGAELLTEILRGGADAAEAAGASVVGGHSIDDPEPKYGMAVTRTVHPDRLLTNAGGRAGDLLVLTKPLRAGAVATAVKRRLTSHDRVLQRTNAGGGAGDLLVLTKPLGAGAVATAIKRGLTSDDVVVERAIAVMTALNATACAQALAAGAHAATDVTGFGLLNHLNELATASGVAAEVDAAAVPAIDGVLDLLDQAGAIAGGTRRNRAHAETFSSFGDAVEEARRWLVTDAMTSGGLLVAVAPCDEHTIDGWVVGRLVTGEPGAI